MIVWQLMTQSKQIMLKWLQNYLNLIIFLSSSNLIGIVMVITGLN